MKHVIPGELYKNVYYTLLYLNHILAMVSQHGVEFSKICFNLYLLHRKNVLELCLAINLKMITWTNLKPVQEQGHLKIDF